MEADDVSFEGSTGAVIYPKGINSKSKIGMAIGSSQMYKKAQQQKEKAQLQTRLLDLDQASGPREQPVQLDQVVTSSYNSASKPQTHLSNIKAKRDVSQQRYKDLKKGKSHQSSKKSLLAKLTPKPLPKAPEILQSSK